MVVLGGVGLGRISKSVTDSDGDDRSPGEAIQYRITIENPNDRDVFDVTLDDRPRRTWICWQVVSVTGVDGLEPEIGRRC
ncbi:MAG: hypothetical protein R3F43_24315 [bacterium]